MSFDYSFGVEKPHEQPLVLGIPREPQEDTPIFIELEHVRSFQKRFPQLKMGLLIPPISGILLETNGAMSACQLH